MAQFANEEVPFNHGYLSGYNPNPICRPGRKLRSCFGSREGPLAFQLSDYCTVIALLCGRRTGSRGSPTLPHRGAE